MPTSLCGLVSPWDPVGEESLFWLRGESAEARSQSVVICASLWCVGILPRESVSWVRWAILSSRSSESSYVRASCPAAYFAALPFYVTLCLFTLDIDHCRWVPVIDAPPVCDVFVFVVFVMTMQVLFVDFSRVRFGWSARPAVDQRRQEVIRPEILSCPFVLACRNIRCFRVSLWLIRPQISKSLVVGHVGCFTYVISSNSIGQLFPSSLSRSSCIYLLRRGSEGQVVSYPGCLGLGADRSRIGVQ